MFYHRESQHGSKVAFVQPYPDGSVKEFTWKDAGEQVRKMASYLQHLDLEPGSPIALMSNNCVHWIMADIAIWMAGHISVPLYPILSPSSIKQILDHSGAKALFVGKLTGWETMQAGVPADIHRITFPLTPQEFRGRDMDWDQVMAQFKPLAESPVIPLDNLATIIYTSGTTGMPKGVMHSFRTMDNVRIGISGAAPLSTSLMAWYRSLNIEILEGYAMSENFAYSHSTPLGESKIGYVGCANPGVTCKISEQGEILVKSPTNMLGYYKEPELTAEAIDDEGFMHTGDKGEIDDHGRLKITGRIKEIFKTSKGKYVAPAPIEDLLLTNTSLEQVCVTGADLPQPIALVTLSEQAATLLDNDNGKAELVAALEQLRRETNAKLDKHENLSHIVVFDQPWTVESNMMTPTLKLKRAAIEEQYTRHFESWCSNFETVVFGGTRFTYQSPGEPSPASGIS